MDTKDAQREANILESRLRVMQDQIDTLQAAVAWMLSDCPNDRGLLYLDAQMTAFSHDRKDKTKAHFVSELQEDVASLRARRDHCPISAGVSR